MFMYVLQIVVCPFVLFLLTIVLSVLLRHTDSDYLPFVSSNSSCPFVLFLLTIVLSVLLRHTDSDYLPLVSSNSSCPFVLFLLTIVLSVLRYTDSDYPFRIFKLVLYVCFVDVMYFIAYFLNVFYCILFLMYFIVYYF